MTFATLAGALAVAAATTVAVETFDDKDSSAVAATETVSVCNDIVHNRKTKSFVVARSILLFYSLFLFFFFVVFNFIFRRFGFG